MASSSDSSNPPEAPSADPAAVNFEQTLARLEEIVHLLEDGKIGLDEALGRYEEGVGLLRNAYTMLQRAERKIAVLTGLDSDGNPILSPIEDSASFSLDDGAAGREPAAPRQVRSGPRRRRTGASDAP